jgi:hypothetical protein
VENLLLVFDEIDDLFSTVGLIWRPIVSFLGALATFIATGFVFLSFPLAAEFLAVALVSIGVLEMLRQRRLQQGEMRAAATAEESP